MTDFDVLLPILIPIAVIAVIALTFGRLALRLFARRRLLQQGELGMARVISLSQTGTTVNQRPEMRITLDIERGGEQPRRVTIRQLVDLGAVPRAGDRVYVIIDPSNLDNVTLAPSPSGAGVTVQTAEQDGSGEQQVDLSDDAVRDIVAMSPRLREHGKLGIARVVAMSPTATTATTVVLDIDAIGASPRRVSINQIVDGKPPAVGDRVYILVDPDDPACVALTPASMTGGPSIPPGTNRLDALVLGPQLLHAGAKAAGMVKTATEQPMADARLAAAGASKWRLDLEVRPEDGSTPYQAVLTIALTTREKAARVAYVGAQVPLRYDPQDQQTVAIDSIAMGYGDPYEDVQKMLNRAAA